MPADTHQAGQAIDEGDVLGFLCALLDDPVGGEAATLAEAGVDEEALGALWDAVCEEFAERTVTPEVDPEALEPTMTLRAAARMMAAQLGAEA